MAADGFISLFPIVFVLLAGGFIWTRVRRTAESAPAPTGSPVTALNPEYKGVLAFFRRHYNGDYSLARSYWINTFLVSLSAPLLGTVLLQWLGEDVPARVGSAILLLVTVLGLVVWCWAITGTWASANKHVQRGGKSRWAAAAKFMIVIGLLKTFGDLGNMAPMLQEHIQVAAGAQLGPETKLELRADGRSILLSGGINDGSAAILDKALQMAPSVKTVVLSSNGGWIREGRLLAAVVRKYDLNTYVENRCASACTIAFLAGRDRAAAPSARIGFHASRSVGSTYAAPHPAETAELRALYRNAGLPDSFIDRALETSHQEMWYPSHEELLSAGVLNRRSLGGETAAISTSIRSKETLIKEFKSIEMYALLAERAPEDFDSVMSAAWARMQQGATDAEVLAAARARLATALPRFLPLASDETLVAYHSLTQEQLEALRARDLSACVEMAFPSDPSMSVAAKLPAELSKRELVIMTKVLREADPARRIKPSPSAIDKVARRAAARMTEDELRAFADESARQLPPALVCNAAVKFFAGLGAIPLAERGHALRILYSAN